MGKVNRAVPDQRSDRKPLTINIFVLLLAALVIFGLVNYVIKLLT